MKQPIFLSIIFSFSSLFTTNGQKNRGAIAPPPRPGPTEFPTARPTYNIQPSFVQPPSTDPRYPPEKYCDFKCMPTVRPAKPFDAKADADVIRKAMKGIGSNGKDILDILTKRSLIQRLQIAEGFKSVFNNRDLVKELKEQTNGDFQDVLVALMTPVPIFLAKELQFFMAGFGSDEVTVVEILCALSNFGLKSIASFFPDMYNKTLEDYIKSDTSGNLQQLLLSMIQGKRNENHVVDNVKARADAQVLYKSGERNWGTNDSVFSDIIATRSYQQLKQIFIEYKTISEVEIEESIDRIFVKGIRVGLLAFVGCVRSKVAFFAERLRQSMKGMGTRHRTLNRIIVSRSEIDLADIRLAYEDIYNGKTLLSRVDEDTSGSYGSTLLSLVRG